MGFINWIHGTWALLCVLFIGGIAIAVSEQTGLGGSITLLSIVAGTVLVRRGRRQNRDSDERLRQSLVTLRASAEDTDALAEQALGQTSSGRASTARVRGVVDHRFSPNEAQINASARLAPTQVVEVPFDREPQSTRRRPVLPPTDSRVVSPASSDEESSLSRAAWQTAWKQNPALAMSQLRTKLRGGSDHTGRRQTTATTARKGKAN